MPRSLTDGGNTVVTTRLPSAGFSITIRIAVTADASSIGRLTTCVGEADAIVTALDVVDSDPNRVLVDLTCDTADATHADQVVKTLERLDGVDVRKVSDRTFLLHLGGKIESTRKSHFATATNCPWRTPLAWPGSAWPSPRTPPTRAD
jgi:malate dehydrogenase (oxaloacetate-decarboxylating)